MTQYAPMRTVLARPPFAHSGWPFQRKLDGSRYLRLQYDKAPGDVIREEPAR
jgi:hypothetical protein